jgi:hypothetical protein
MLNWFCIAPFNGDLCRISAIAQGAFLRQSDLWCGSNGSCIIQHEPLSVKSEEVILGRASAVSTGKSSRHSLVPGSRNQKVRRGRRLAWRSQSSRSGWVIGETACVFRSKAISAA